MISASGILANDENSSTSLPISSTCLDMVFVRRGISSFEKLLSWNFFSILSADNFIGVRGFLTSCAIFLAISDQAACFSAKINDYYITPFKKKREKLLINLSNNLQ